VSPSEFRSWTDVLSPRWKDRIAMRDPRVAGGSRDIAVFWYTSDALGKAFMQQFFTQGVVLTRDERQLLDWVVRGQYQLGIGASDLLATEQKSKGVPIEMIDAEASLAEGAFLASGLGNVSVVNRAPHPNATRVYLNWLLSREGQTAWSRASGNPSRRLDIPTDHLDPALVPNPNTKYVHSYKESLVRMIPEVDEYLKTLLGP
jgi:iron(III) transport system substrate-binding protein